MTIENADPYIESEAWDAAARAAELEPAEPRYASLADLTAPAVPAATREEDFELESGLSVRIRPLTRAEVMLIGKRDLPTDKKEAAYVAKAMVLPAMSEKDVAKWQDNSAAGDMQELVERIQKISGMSKKGAKAAAEEFPRSGE